MHAAAGPHQTSPQPYLFGSRGRMDERLDCVRSVTDGRFVYIRNFYPHVSQAQRVAFQFETTTTALWRRLFDEGKTNDAQSLFWRTPKAAEELYDLQSDRDEVKNLATSAQHRATLEKLRNAVRAQAEKSRDVAFLPEGEIHSRAQGSTPYDMARDEKKYPFKQIYAAADLASRMEAAALPQLEKLITDSDSAIRYWGALGFLMRGKEGVTRGSAALRKALNDSSPFVRIVAAEALATHGTDSDLTPSLNVLRELLPQEKNGVFVTMASLSAIEALGPKAAPLHDAVRTMKPEGGSPHNRFDSYVPRLIANIAPPPETEKSAGGGKKAKGKKKTANE